MECIFFAKPSDFSNLAILHSNSYEELLQAPDNGASPRMPQKIGTNASFLNVTLRYEIDFVCP